MEESEGLEELNRLVSGELSEDQSLALQRRMLQDPELRAKYERLLEVNTLLREAYLDTEAAGEVSQEQAAELMQVPHDERRFRHIDEIVEQIQQAALRRQRRKMVRFPRLPWGIAAALVVALGLALIVGPQIRRSPWFAAKVAIMPLSKEQVAQYARLRNKLGHNMVIIFSEGAGSYEAVSGRSLRPVVVRVTVVRTDGEGSRQWTADAVVPQGRTVELVTRETSQWPASIRISAQPDGDAVVPVTLQARLVRDALSEINLTARVGPSEPRSVSVIEVGGARYEVFVQAERIAPGTETL